MSALSNILDPDILQEAPNTVDNPQDSSSNEEGESDSDQEIEPLANNEIINLVPSSLFSPILEMYGGLIRGIGFAAWAYLMRMDVVAGGCAFVIGMIIYAIYHFAVANYEKEVVQRREVEAVFKHMITFKQNPNIEQYKSILAEIEKLEMPEESDTGAAYPIWGGGWIGAVLNEYPAFFTNTYEENRVCDAGTLNAYNMYFENNELQSTTVKINIKQFVKCAIYRYMVSGKRDHRITDWRTRVNLTLEDRLSIGSLDVLFDESDRENSALLAK